MLVSGSGGPSGEKSSTTSSTGRATTSRAWYGSALACCAAFRCGTVRSRTSTCWLAIPRITLRHSNLRSCHRRFNAAVSAPCSTTTPFTTVPGGSSARPAPLIVTDGRPSRVPGDRIAARTEVAPMSSPMAWPSVLTTPTLLMPTWRCFIGFSKKT